MTNILCDSGYTGLSFAQSIKEAIDCSVEIIQRFEQSNLLYYRKDGLWNELLLGWTITADFGRIVNAHLKTVDRAAYWQV